jgi:hypothetical protein
MTLVDSYATATHWYVPEGACHWMLLVVKLFAPVMIVVEHVAIPVVASSQFRMASHTKNLRGTAPPEGTLMVAPAVMM